MGVFANMYVSESSYDYGAEDVLSNVPAYEFDRSSSLIEASMEGILESERNWNNMMLEMANREYSVLEATGREIVYEGVDIKGIFNKVVEWFKGVWEKISGLFKKFLAFISSKISSDKKFLVNYEVKIKNGYNNLKSDGFSCKCYDYKNIDKVDYISMMKTANEMLDMFVGEDFDGMLKLFMSDKMGGDDKLKDLIEKYKDNRKDLEDTMRALILKDTSKDKISAGDFARVAKEYLRGDSFTTFKKSDNHDWTIDIIIGTIRDAKVVKAKAKASYNALKSSLNAVIAYIKTMQNKVLKEKEDAGQALSCCNIMINTLKQLAVDYERLNGVHLSLLGGMHSQAKKLALGCMNSKNQVGTSESAFFDSEDVGALFDM